MENIPQRSEMEPYDPSDEQQLQVKILQQVVSLCENAKIDICIAGGYGLDGLYGRLTRDHGDIDLVVEEEKIQDFCEVIERIGFVEDTTNEDKNKMVYVPGNTLPLPNTFKIEFASASLLKRLIPENEPLELIVPNETNATLEDFSFKTLTPVGQKLAAEMQNTRATKENWGEYKYKDHFEKLMRAIENK